MAISLGEREAIRWEERWKGKPRLLKVKHPRYYKKKLMVKTEVLERIHDEELQMELCKQLNETLLIELGTFGDIVELSRRQLLEGYVRPSTPDFVKKARLINQPVKPEE